MMSVRRLGWTCVLLVLAVLPAPATAQVQDSVELRIRESLRRLERPPAPDTAALDTAVVITGARPGGARAPAPAGRDSVAQALLGLAGYGAAQYEGLAAEFDATERVLILHGDSTRRASLVHEGAELTADSVIRYDEVSGQVQGLGRPVYTPPQGDPVTSREIIYDLAEQRGTALGARTRYSEGATWYVTGDLPSVSPDVVYGSETHFTSCDLEVPHYHFAAAEIKIIAGRVLVARPVKLYFGDVPVAWFPFIAQSLGSGRASGLLTPRFSVNDIVRTSGGYRRRVSNVGFYWAMSDYADATVALDWFSDNFTSVTGSLRYAWARQFLNGTVNMRRYWQAGGGTQFAFDTNNSWQMDERTSFRMSARYSSSADFIRRNSFDPREVTQSINSTGGLNRRFDWGNVSLSGNRDQYLSDDRLEMTLPEVQLNLSSITLFRAPPGRGSWWNNLTWSGGAGGSRRTIDRAPEPGETISAATADLENIGARARSSFNLGKLSWSQSFTLERASVLQVPVGFGDPVLGFSPSGQRLVPMAVATTEPGETLRDITRTDLFWQTSLGYQQPLIGSTTLTPSLTLQGNARRSDTIDVASDHFVSGPVRLSFGARLQSDLFGFLPGIGPFEAIRHKLSPGIDFSYAPEVASSELQERVFGRQAIRPRKQLTFSVNQTFEAKRRQVDTVAAAPPPGAPADHRSGAGRAAPRAPAAGHRDPARAADDRHPVRLRRGGRAERPAVRVPDDADQQPDQLGLPAWALDLDEPRPVRRPDRSASRRRHPPRAALRPAPGRPQSRLLARPPLGALPRLRAVRGGRGRGHRSSRHRDRGPSGGSVPAADVGHRREHGHPGTGSTGSGRPARRAAAPRAAGRDVERELLLFARSPARPEPRGQPDAQRDLPAQAYHALVAELADLVRPRARWLQRSHGAPDARHPRLGGALQLLADRDRELGVPLRCLAQGEPGHPLRLQAEQRGDDPHRALILPVRPARPSFLRCPSPAGRSRPLQGTPHRSAIHVSRCRALASRAVRPLLLRRARAVEPGGGIMTRRVWGSVAVLALAGCDSVGVDVPDAPCDLAASYYAGAVTLSWELGSGWDGESFRVYAKRASDTRYAVVAEVTSCIQGFCSYTDVNVESGRSYDYYVAAVDPGSGAESASASAVQVEVPDPTPPPVPVGLRVVALDHTNYLTWGDNVRDAPDFSHYRVWLRSSEGSEFLLRETDSEGFLDQLPENGLTYSYFVTAMDAGGHESAGSALGHGTPRPD